MGRANLSQRSQRFEAKARIYPCCYGRARPHRPYDADPERAHCRPLRGDSGLHRSGSDRRGGQELGGGDRVRRGCDHRPARRLACAPLARGVALRHSRRPAGRSVDDRRGCGPPLAPRTPPVACARVDPGPGPRAGRRLPVRRAPRLRALGQLPRQGSHVDPLRLARAHARDERRDRPSLRAVLDRAGARHDRRRPLRHLGAPERRMKAVVMAGGEGTRLRPLTSNQPKPMVPIVGKPCMEHILELLKEHEFEEVIVTLAFLPQAIRGYFGTGESLGMGIEYSVEETPLGTAGSVRLASDRLDETFLVISGDALCDFDLSALVDFHKQKGAAVTIGLKSVENPLEFGIVVTDEDGRIERFLEKPSWSQVFSDTINTGVYVLEPEVLRHIPDDRPFDFSKELFPLLLEMGRPLYGYV